MSSYRVLSFLFSTVLLAGVSAPIAEASGFKYRGNLSANPYAPNSISNPYGAGNPHHSDSLNNPYGAGNPYNQKKVILKDSNGNFRGNLNTNQYDPDSVSNPYGKYGSPYSPDSINNPFGAGSRYQPDSPNNPYGNGLEMYQEK